MRGGCILENTHNLTFGEDLGIFQGKKQSLAN